uniref:Uncharacterized protein n=1 Tax=Rhizophora mucronata TaxID=61149 RepID=A0A2P2PIR0_RHIMU
MLEIEKYYILRFGYFPWTQKYCKVKRYCYGIVAIVISDILT